MKQIALLLMLGLMMATAPSAADATTLAGEYNWGDRTQGDLEAIFKPVGEGKWTVDFHFDFRGESHLYSGTAEGSLAKGPLKGEVQDEKKNRTFTFDGKMKKGKFHGTHAEIRGDGERQTGTLTLGD